MRISRIMTAVLLLLCCNVFAQNNFNCFVKEAEGKEALEGVTAKINGSAKATASDSSGKISFKNLSPGKIKIVFSFVGYEDQELDFQIPQTDAATVIYLKKKEDKRAYKLLQKKPVQ